MMGTNVREVGAGEAGAIVPNVDGLITTEPNLFLCLTVADCLPVYFESETAGVVGLAHAGWRGLTAGIIESLIEKFVALGEAATTLSVFVGPGIHQCHFEVRDDVLPVFENYPEEIIPRREKYAIDLYAIVKKKLFSAGVSPASVAVSNECTACLPEKYFSYRRDKPARTEAMLAYIGRQV